MDRLHRPLSLVVKASMVWKILLIVAAGVPGAFLATVVYVALLLLIAKHFSGIMKVVAAMLVYILYSVVMVAPLFYMLGEFRPEINASGLSMGIVMLSWGVVVAPSMVYLGKYKNSGASECWLFPSTPIIALTIRVTRMPLSPLRYVKVTGALCVIFSCL